MEPAGAASSSVDRRAPSFVATGNGGCAFFLEVDGTVSVSGPPHPTMLPSYLRQRAPRNNHRLDHGEREMLEGHCALCGESLARIDIFFYDDSRFCSAACRTRRMAMDEEPVAAVEERSRRAERGSFWLCQRWPRYKSASSFEGNEGDQEGSGGEHAPS